MFPTEPTQPARQDLESELQLVEQSIVDPDTYQASRHTTLTQAAWLLIALGRLDPALAAAELSQTCWGIAKDASGTPFGGGLSWDAHRAAAVAHMAVQNWGEADEYLLDVLRDFGEESKSFYLHELCRHARGLRWDVPVWDVLKDPDRALATFDARTYALEQYRSERTPTEPARATGSGSTAPTPAGSTPVAPDPGVRWREVPIPPEIADRDWTASRIDSEPNPTIQQCAIAVFGSERYARESQLSATQRNARTNPSKRARAHTWALSFPRALGRPGER